MSEKELQIKRNKLQVKAARKNKIKNFALGALGETSVFLVLYKIADILY